LARQLSATLVIAAAMFLLVSRKASARSAPATGGLSVRLDSVLSEEEWRFLIALVPFGRRGDRAQRHHFDSTRSI
jgi:hypothetical protein